MKITNIVKLYYSIWTDGIIRMQERFPESNFFWKFMTMFIMVFSLGGFSMFFYMFIARIIGLPWPQLNIFQNDILEIFSSTLVFFILPWLIINYYLVFWKNKYLNFLPKYKYRKGKLFVNFFLCIIFMPLFILIVAMIITKLTA